MKDTIAQKEIYFTFKKRGEKEKKTKESFD